MEKGKVNIEYRFLTKEDLYSPEYIELQNKIHGENGYNQRIKRIEHYLDSEDFCVIVALVNGKMVGQASGYGVTAVIEGKEQPFYWGCDTFLLKEVRGLGIGKHLQNELHKRCPNFSSAWYSPINGIIKRRCGASELCELKFTYYPVSNFVGILFQLFSAKVLKRQIKIKFNIPNFYYLFNSLFFRNKILSKNVIEIPCDDLSETLSSFMEEALKGYSFHIKRSLDFLKWAYGWEKGKYHMLAFTNGQRIEAVVAFSNVHEATHVIARFKGVSILDLIISPKSNLTVKDILFYVIKYYKDKKESVEGLITFEQMKYFPKFIYPYPYTPLLSTYGKKLKNGYIAFIDQDMDQL